MGVIGSILVKLTAGTAEFDEKMQRAGKGIEDFGHKAEASSGLLSKFTEGFEVGAGIEAFKASLEALEAPFEKLKQSFEELTAMGHDALKLGVSAEDMSRFQHAANATGTDIGVLTQGVNKLDEEIGKVASGDKGADKAAAALQKLGLDAKVLASQNPAETFKQVSAAIAGMGDSYSRAAVMQDLMGRGGRELLPLMAELDDSLKESDEIGFTRTAEDFRKAAIEEKELANAVDRLKGMLMDMATSDVAMKIAHGFQDAAKWVGEMRDAITVLNGGNAAQDRHIAEINALEKQRLDVQIKMAELTKASAATADFNEKIANQQKLIALAKEDYDLRHKLALAGDSDKWETDYHFSSLIVKGSQIVLDNLQKQKDAQDAANAAVERQAAARQKVADEIRKTTEHLKSQLDAQSGDKYGISKLIADGATPKQIGEVMELIKRLEDAEAQHKRMEKAKEIWQQAETPLQKYNDRLKELADLLQHGALSQEQFAQASKKAKDELDKAQRKDNKEPSRESEAPGAMRRFAFDDLSTKESPEKRIEQLTEQQLDLWRTMSTQFADIWRIITDPTGGVNGNSDNVVDF